MEPSAEGGPTFLHDDWAALRAWWAEVRMWWPLFAVLLLAALATRFWQLSAPVMWMDEITILNEAYTQKYRLISDKGHIAHLKPVHFFMHLFGQDAFGLRFWGALMGALAVPVLALAAFTLAGAELAIFAGAAALVNCFLLFYAQDGNYYGPMTFYTALQLLLLFLFFRGVRLTSLALCGAVALVNFKNHPMSAFPSMAILGTMALGTLAEAKSLYSVKMSEWLRRPMLPLAIAGAAAFFAFGLARVKPLLLKTRQLIAPGEGTLANVELSWEFFRDHLTAFGVNQFRPDAIDEKLALVPFAVFLAGIGAWCWSAGKEPARRWICTAAAMVAVGAPLASYLFIFNLKMDRNFNIRYFTALVPIYLLGIGVGCALLARLLRFGGRPWSAAAAGIPLFAIWIAATVQYFAADKSVYTSPEVLGAEKSNGRIVSLTRNDRVEAEYYVPKVLGADAVKSPRFTFLNQPAHPELMSAAFPYFMNGEGRTVLFSAWRQVEMPSLFALCGMLEPVADRPSKLGERHDLKTWIWDVEERVVYPHAAARFDVVAGEAILVSGAGEWRLSAAAKAIAGVDSLKSDGPMRIVAKAAGTLAAVPVLPPKLALGAESVANFPTHTKIIGVESAGRTLLRNERDDSFDFIVFQPRAEKRHLVIETFSRKEDDLLTTKNNDPIPHGMWITVAVDGRHAGTWDVPRGQPGPVRIPIELDLAPGNHRLSIMALMPRHEYSPYFPWYFAGIEWNAGPAPQPTASLEQQGTVRLVPAWDALPGTGLPGGPIGEIWLARGDCPTQVDELRAPAGDYAIRVDYPIGKQAPMILLAPMIELGAGTHVLLSYYIKLSAMEESDLSNYYRFLDSRGRPVVQNNLAVGANARGTTYGKGWLRRQVMLPIPPDAQRMIFGWVTNPASKERTVSGSIWTGSFTSAGMDVKFADPALADSFFGFAEEAIDQ